ncbi:unnamed protein product [Eruca vesicaria subsp. sativa]|uniref:Protamine P1 family protein n=1 Tax=Eruca vesicaria subsp. sativa TaxID=29727 RepID=A0ABC8LD24_ERUVS|nr:unnamed protein product [Eruca vesicaria subsp. sativa]
MSFSSRPVSSPGRTENPPLLMRFLRTTAGSRSRHRSRSRPRSKKPIFFRRKNATETQEPSSPKVTCMGQVRITRSKKPKPGTNRVNGGHLRGGANESRRRRRCGWVKNAFSCHPFSGRLKPTCFTPAWRKWKSFTNVSFSRKSEKRSSSSRSEPIFSRSTVEPEEAEEVRKKERKQEEEDEDLPATPPRNAFLLTRCRSAPYRSPSLGDNFLEEETKESHFQRHGNDVIASPENVSVSSEVSEGVKRCVLGSPRRQCMVLTRCKSEPARLGEKLVPENRRLGYT